MRSSAQRAVGREAIRLRSCECRNRPGLKPIRRILWNSRELDPLCVVAYDVSMVREYAPDTPHCPPEVLELIKRFDRHQDTYKKATYNETNVRREFIDPFFTALGWDIDNNAGLAEAYKDVIHEDAIKIGGTTKAPDYCFRIGQTRKFFVEAKKPSVGLATDPEPAYQLRRYGWTAKLSLSILTDFEEFAVYDCRIGPKKGDKASVARVFFCTFDQYADKWRAEDRQTRTFDANEHIGNRVFPMCS